MSFLIVVAVFQPLAPLRAQGPNKKTKRSEAEYQACLKQARDLQKRYSQCSSKECSDAVTKDFEAWSVKCFND